MRRREGSWPEAIDAYRSALAIMEKLVALAPDDIGRQRDLWDCYHKIADVQAIAGPRADALATYRRSLKAILGLARQAPRQSRPAGGPGVQLQPNCNRAAKPTSNMTEALDAYRKALTIHLQLAAAEANNTGRQRDVFLSFNRVAGALAALGQREEAIATYRKALAIMEQLAPSDPGNAQWQQDLVGVYDRLGTLFADSGRPDEVRRTAGSARAARRHQPANEQWQYDLAVNYLKVGHGLLAVGRQVEALAIYRKTLPIFERLVGRGAREARAAEQSVARSSQHRRGAGGRPEWVEAREAYDKSVDIRERLAASDPKQPAMATRLAFALERRGKTFVETSDLDPALADYRRALAIRRGGGRGRAGQYVIPARVGI